MYAFYHILKLGVAFLVLFYIFIILPAMVNRFVRYVLSRRLPQVEAFIQHPLEKQEAQLNAFISQGKHTAFGKEHGVTGIKTYDQFSRQVPISTYEELHPYIHQSMQGARDVLWPGRVKWFAKSSGTTNDRSKFIPLTPEALKSCHFKAGMDIYTLYVAKYPDTRLWEGKGLAVGGSCQINEKDPSGVSRYGDISGVILHNMPPWAQMVRAPKLSVALMDNWEEKIGAMARDAINRNITHMAGVPTWTALLLQHILKQEGKDSINEIWPNLEVFFHGAVSFTPYQDLFDSLIKKSNMRYWETYNASEGFFGIQDGNDANDMLLLTDHGIFYEFIPMDKLGDESPVAIPLADVETEKNYALVISTNGGLWRYMIGDTVKFTSVNPYRFVISGRTKHFINAFGEEVIVENAEVAIAQACKTTGALIDNYTAAPVYIEKDKRGGHEWIIEFKSKPTNLKEFIRVLDETLREVNSDYDAKRSGDAALVPPIVHEVEPKTFYNWMSKRGKLGGQHKVPRLSNTREYVEDILTMVNQ